MASLKGVPILTANLLREAWPCMSVKESRLTTKEGEENWRAEIDDEKLSSLTDTTLRVAVKHSIESGDTTELEKILWLPGKASLVKAVLRSSESITQGAVHLLSVALAELKEKTWVDLSGFQLSGPQVVDVLSALDEVESLDLSYNNVVAAEDIPNILAAVPTVRRLTLMGCPSVEDARLLELVQTQPAAFRDLEGILHPTFLTIRKPEPYPAAFTYVTVGYSGKIACASIPFFTPAQVVQALTDVVPWRSGYTEMNIMKTGIPLTGCAAFHGGARRPGQSFSERTVVSVPLLTPKIPRAQKELWTFYAAQKDTVIGSEAVLGWGFIRYVPEDSSESGDTAPIWTCHSRRGLDRPLGYRGTVYDLQGFLEHMRAERRPMPTDEAVQKLQEILFMESEKGKYICPYMGKGANVHNFEYRSKYIYGERYQDFFAI